MGVLTAEDEEAVKLSNRVCQMCHRRSKKKKMKMSSCLPLLPKSLPLPNPSKRPKLKRRQNLCLLDLNIITVLFLCYKNLLLFFCSAIHVRIWWREAIFITLLKIQLLLKLIKLTSETRKHYGWCLEKTLTAYLWWLSKCKFIIGLNCTSHHSPVSGKEVLRLVVNLKFICTWNMSFILF